MKTIIHILGAIYFLHIRGQADDAGNYQNWKETWDNGGVLNFSWWITQDKDPCSDRVAFQDSSIVLLHPDEQGAVFGYAWCSKEYLCPKDGEYAHGLVGMRYGQECAKGSVFFDASSLEFNWRLRVSKTIYDELTKIPATEKAPSGMSTLPTSSSLDPMPELFKKKISTLTFREKLMRFRRKSTTAVYAAIVDEFTSFNGQRKLGVMMILQQANFNSGHMVELIEELYDIGRKEDVIRQEVGEEQELPAGL